LSGQPHPHRHPDARPREPARRLSREAFAAEAEAPLEAVDRLVAAGAITPDADGRFSARDEVVASTTRALLDAGIELDDLIAMLADRRVGIRSLGFVFSEPPPRSPQTYAELTAELGADPGLMTRVYAALGLPEPDPDGHPRIDEAELVTGYAHLWNDVDPTGDAHIRVARVIGDATRRVAETWLDVWDEVARPDATSQGAPTVGPHARPADPSDPDQNASIRMAELSRRIVALVHERQIEATLNARILNLLERVLGEAGRLPARSARPPAVAFVDLSGFTSLTDQRGDEVAASMASDLLALAEAATRRDGGRVVKQLADGVLLRFPDAVAALRVVGGLVGEISAAGLPPAHAGVAAGPVIVRDGDVFGRTVNLASRLSDAAAPGETLVEEGVVVALPRGTARFEPRGRIELAGFGELVAVWRAMPADGAT
jgi:class 3 adenylate cyclase